MKRNPVFFGRRYAALQSMGVACLLLACSDPSSFDANPVTQLGASGGASGRTGGGVSGSSGANTGGVQGASGDQGGGDVEVCGASPEWLPVTPSYSLVPGYFKPAPHPTTECPFYRGGWNNFLLAMQPDPGTGDPAIKSFPTVDDLFERYTPLPADALAPPGQPRGTPLRSWLGDIHQAGGRQILIDQNGHTLYYGLHVNQAFSDFLKANNLTTPKAVQNADPTLFFPSGIAEFKTAWQMVDDANPPDDLDQYVVTKAWVPHLTQDPTSHVILEDRDHPDEVTVRLLAIHCVFTLPGHPEFVWASFEHSAGTPDTAATDGQRNVAPIHPGDINPPPTDLLEQNDTAVISETSGLLYKAGTTAQDANQAIPDQNLVLDEATQTFRLASDGSLAQTSIFRMFPGSKSNTTDPDDAITSLNHNVETLFAEYADHGQLDPNDRRMHYRLIGAQWMDKPVFFGLNRPLQNDPTSPLLQGDNTYPDVNQADDRAATLAAGDNGVDDIAANGSDSAFSILAGEDRLSSTAMESFTQALSSFPNCFTCHNTQAVTAKGVPTDHDEGGVQLLAPKLLNVSHILSEIVLEECDKPENLQQVANPNGTTTNVAVCP